ncbi:MAG: type II toxin-antitoxin system VapC family toxin [Deltaproteobacteria bacterium]|nr:type II toxin-antitoxin system VapC family toxin [Deltaproteobacteria bacterium]
MIFVVDASVACRWLLSGEAHPHAQAVLERMLSSPRLFAVPELFSFEVYAVLCRLHPKPLEAFARGIMPILQGGILRHPMTEPLAEAAMRFVDLGLTGYDACYAALASELGGVWLTFDTRAHLCIAGEQLSCSLADELPPGF